MPSHLQYHRSHLSVSALFGSHYRAYQSQLQIMDTSMSSSIPELGMQEKLATEFILHKRVMN